MLFSQERWDILFIKTKLYGRTAIQGKGTVLVLMSHDVICSPHATLAGSKEITFKMCLYLCVCWSYWSFKLCFCHEYKLQLIFWWLRQSSVINQSVLSTCSFYYWVKMQKISNVCVHNSNLLPQSQQNSTSSLSQSYSCCYWECVFKICLFFVLHAVLNRRKKSGSFRCL